MSKYEYLAKRFKGRLERSGVGDGSDNLFQLTSTCSITLAFSGRTAFRKRAMIGIESFVITGACAGKQSLVITLMPANGTNIEMSGAQHCEMTLKVARDKLKGFSSFLDEHFNLRDWEAEYLADKTNKDRTDTAAAVRHEEVRNQAIVTINQELTHYGTW